MILEIEKNQYFCTFCQRTWVGVENTCGCYDGKKQEKSKRTGGRKK